jgi:hypothetical protein
VGSILLLVILVASLIGSWVVVGTLRDRAGSAVTTATVDRVVALDKVVARVDEPGDEPYRDVRLDTRYDRRAHRWLGPGYVRGTRIEVRCRPHDDGGCTDTAGELRLPGAWVLAVPAAGLVVGAGGLLLLARRRRARSS